MHKHTILKLHQELAVFRYSLTHSLTHSLTYSLTQSLTHSLNHSIREREIMFKMEHPFIAAMYATIQDARCIYLVQQYVSGGDLWQYLYGIKSPKSKLGGLPLPHVVFYATNALSTLTYLHDNDIAFRDFKIENFVLGTSLFSSSCTC